MVYTFVINIVYLNLNSILNILNTITTKHRFLANKSTKLWKLSLMIFERFWPFEPPFVMNFFLKKKNVYSDLIGIKSVLNCQYLYHCLPDTVKNFTIVAILTYFFKINSQAYDILKIDILWRHTQALYRIH